MPPRLPGAVILRAGGMRHFLGIVLFAPLALVVGIFAVENRTPLTLQVWPLQGAWEMWASVWILGLLAAGIVIGMAVGWLSGLGWRRRARRAERLVRKYERESADREEDEDRPPAAPVARPAAGLPAPEARARRTALLGD